MWRNTGTKSPAQMLFPNCSATTMFADVAFTIVHQVCGRNDAHVGWRDASAVGVGLAALDVGTSSRMCAACWRSIRASVRYTVCAALTAACGATKGTCQSDLLSLWSSGSCDVWNSEGRQLVFRSFGCMSPTHAEYTWPGSNWRPSACGADVIATRPQVLLGIQTCRANR